ncbi:hypothetical protein RBB50_001956 [Rhinocladiella similis]
MAIDNIPTSHTLKQAFELDVYTPDGVPLPFGSLFDHHDADDKTASTSSSTTINNILVVFIRHFFCGNCQEYVRRLSSPASPFHPTRRRAHLNFSKPNTHPPPSVIIIGPGSPSLLSSYAALTQCAYPVYADPSTQLYDVLGMHKTLSMGGKHPEYIQHNLLGAAVKSAWQIVKRVGSGDALDGGDWHVNGGEFLFVQKDTVNQSSSRHKSGSSSRSRSKSTSPPPLPGSRTRSSSARSSSRDTTPSGSSSSSSSGTKPGWEVRWCHRMLNSRDHTELQDLYHNTCSSSVLSLPPRPGSRTASPAPLRSILVNGGGAHASPSTSTTHFRHPRSQSRSSARTLSRSYSSECLGACPGPDIPKSRDEALLNQALYASSSASARPGSKSSHHRPRSRSASLSSGRDKHQRSKSVASLTRADSRLAEGGDGEDYVQPRRSFSLGLASKMGMLGRSKSLSAKRNPRTTVVVDEHDANMGGDGVSTSASAIAGPNGNGRKRSLSSLVRSASKKNKTRPAVVAAQVRPQTATPTPSSSQTQIRPQTATPTPAQTLAQQTSSAQNRPDSAVSLSTRIAHHRDEKEGDEKEEKPSVPSPPHPRTSEKKKQRTISFSTPPTTSQPTRRASFSLSRRPKTPSRGTSKMSRGASTIEMDENGIMLVDGVEFVNVISLKARVEDSRRHPQPQPQPQGQHEPHQQPKSQPRQTLPHTDAHTHTHTQHHCTQLHVHDRMAGSVRPLSSTMALGTTAISVHA